MSRTALIAGAGELPSLVSRRQSTPPVIACLEGFRPDGLAPDLTFRIETLGTALADLRARDVTRLALVGRVTRPVIDPAVIDAATAPLIPDVIAAMGQGDDGALRGLIALFEGQGFSVVGVESLAPDLVPNAGVLSGTLTEAMRRDAVRAEAIVAAMGAADVGQAVVVAHGQALAVEALPGTDWMLRSLIGPPAKARPAEPESSFPDLIGYTADWLTGPDGPPGGPPGGQMPKRRRDAAFPAGGILFKAPKPGQELRVDMPTIGPATIAHAAEAELEGVVIEAGGVILIEPETCRAMAEEAGLCLWVRPRGGP